jgi:hypothetical protein
MIGLIAANKLCLRPDEKCCWRDDKRKMSAYSHRALTQLTPPESCQAGQNFFL